MKIDLVWRLLLLLLLLGIVVVRDRLGRGREQLASNIVEVVCD